MGPAQCLFRGIIHGGQLKVMGIPNKHHRRTGNTQYPNRAYMQIFIYNREIHNITSQVDFAQYVDEEQFGYPV